MLQTRRPRRPIHRKTVDLLAQCPSCKRHVIVVGTLWGTRVTDIERATGIQVSGQRVYCTGCHSQMSLYRMNQPNSFERRPRLGLLTA